MPVDIPAGIIEWLPTKGHLEFARLVAKRFDYQQACKMRETWSAVQLALDCFRYAYVLSSRSDLSVRAASRRPLSIALFSPLVVLASCLPCVRRCGSCCQGFAMSVVLVVVVVWLLLWRGAVTHDRRIGGVVSSPDPRVSTGALLAVSRSLGCVIVMR